MGEIKSGTLFTAVSCYISLLVTELGYGEQAVVLASPAASVSGLIGELFELIGSQHSGHLSAVSLFKGI